MDSPLRIEDVVVPCEASILDEVDHELEEWYKHAAEDYPSIIAHL
jgi:hypothetical protein